MPQIPLYQQQTTAGPGFSGPQADPSETGGLIGQAESRLAIGGEQVAVAGRYEQLAQQERTAKAWTAPAVTGAALDWDKNLNDRFAKTQPGDPDITPHVVNDFKAYRDKLIDSAPSPLAKQYVQQHMEALGEQIGKRAIAFDAANRVQGYVNNQLTAIDNSGKLVQQNPAQYPVMMQVIRETMPDVGPQQRQKLLDSATATLTTAAASYYLNADPKTLRDATSKAMGEDGFKGNTGVPWVDEATPEQVAKWNAAAKAKIATQDAAAQTQKDAQDLRNDAQAAYGTAIQRKPGPTGFERMVQITAQSESGGRETNPDGSTVTSPKGAQGVMQVMPSTNANPGFGVTPARDSSPEERARVGRDYLAAMVQRYGGDQQKAWAAYNAGPTTVDKAVQQAAAGRSGSPDWLSYMPRETQGYVQKNVAAFAAPDPGVAPMTTAQLEASEGAVLEQARQQAEKSRPGDAVYAAKLQSEAHTVWARNLQVLRGQDYGNFTAVLDATMKLQATSLSDLPPDLQGTYAALPPQSREGIQAQLARNVRMANGEFTHSDPKLFNDLTQRLYLPDGDPRKLTYPGQLSEFMGKGLNHTDRERLIKEMGEANTGNPFLKRVADAKKTANDMLVQSMTAVAIQHPDLAHLASYRFAYDLDQRINAVRASKGDPATLLDPNSKDFVLAPGRIAGYMPSEQEIAAAKARGSVVPSPNAGEAMTGYQQRVTRQPGETPAQYLARIRS